MKYFTGIGARSTPAEFLKEMTIFAENLRKQDYILRSGHAPGADQAFEAGADEFCDIYLPWPYFESSVEIIGRVIESPSGEAIELAAEFHPRWKSLGNRARLFHARNCHQVLGDDLKTPSEFVVCWTSGGAMKGGTAQALRIAKAYGIEIINWGLDD